MKHILEKGKISQLFSDSGSAGWSGEVHLVTYKGEEYVLRKCDTEEKAKHYEYLSKKFEKYGFLPKFLGRQGKNVLYEYIDGRDLSRKESKPVIKQVGQICAYINRIKAEGKINARFNKQLKEVFSLRLISKETANKSRLLYNYLKKKIKPQLRLDANDVLPNNFRLRKSKVYFVDVESIVPRIRLFAIGKGFLKWFENAKEQKYFKEGYQSVSSMKFFTEKYQDFIYLNWLIQDIYYCHLFRHKQKSGYKHRVKQLKDLLNKYNSKILNLY